MFSSTKTYEQQQLSERSENFKMEVEVCRYLQGASTSPSLRSQATKWLSRSWTTLRSEYVQPFVLKLHSRRIEGDAPSLKWATMTSETLSTLRVIRCCLAEQRRQACNMYGDVMPKSGSTRGKLMTQPSSLKDKYKDNNKLKKPSAVWTYSVGNVYLNSWYCSHKLQTIFQQKLTAKCCSEAGSVFTSAGIPRVGLFRWPENKKSER